MAYIEFNNIHKYFGENHVLKGIDLKIEEGEFVTLLGPSGCGKSTLLRCFAGLEEVSEGSIMLAGTDITSFTPKQRKIGMVFQQYSLFPNMTVRQNVSFGLKLKKMNKKLIDEKVNETLEIVGLSGKAEQYPRQLSGGQQQRVALARAIVMEPRVLLLDEPLSAIDALLRRNLQIEIRRIQQALKMTTIFVTHDQEEAMVMSDKIHLFNEGNIEQSGTPVEMYSSPRTQFAANFIGHYNIAEVQKAVEFKAIAEGAHVFAIRPEAILIKNGKCEGDANQVVLNGKISGVMPRGTTVSYTVSCDNGLSLNADKLFTPEQAIKMGDEVSLCIDTKDILWVG